MAVANMLWRGSGEKPGRLPAALTDRPALNPNIMKFLNDSSAYAHKALNSVTEANVLEPIKSPFGTNMTTRLALATSIIGHPSITMDRWLCTCA